MHIWASISGVQLSDIAVAGVFSAADARRIGVDANLLRRLPAARR